MVFGGTDRSNEPGRRGSPRLLGPRAAIHLRTHRGRGRSFIDAETILRRTVQYGLDHYPAFGREEQYVRCVEHLERKYAEGGYLQLWIAESDNALRLEELRRTIRDKKRLRTLFDEIYDRETGHNPGQ